MVNKILLLFLISLSVFSQDEKRLALVIGNANYEKGELKNPINDARLIASTLDSLDFDVILKENLATKRDMTAAIREFGSRRSEYDVAFVYYAGHGIQVDDENFLLPTEEVFEEEFDVMDYGVSVQNIMRYLTAQTNEVNILILDACRDNPFESNWNTTRSLKGGGLAKIPPPTGSLIAFSTDSGQTAPDGDGDNSIYTISLAKNMLLEDTSIDQVFRNVRTEVLNQTDGMQRPVEATQLTGQTFILKRKNFSALITSAQDDLDSDKVLDAFKKANEILTDNPKNIFALKLLFECNFRLENYGAALNVAENISSFEGFKVEGYVLSYKVYHKLNDYLQAIKFLKNASELDSYYLTDLAFWTFEYFQDYDKAIKLVDKAVALNNDANSYYVKGRLYNDRKMYDKALKNYLEAQNTDNYLTFLKSEKGEDYLMRIAYCYAFLKQNENAVTYSKKAAEYSTGDGWQILQSAGLLSNLSKFKDALEVLEKLKDKNINLDNYHYYKSRILFYGDQQVKDIEQSLVEINKAIEINQNNYNFYFHRGYVQTEIKEFEKAILSYVRSLEMNDKNINSYLNLSYIYGNELLNYPKALGYINKGLEIDNNFYDLRFNKALFLSELKKYDEAITEYNNLIDLHPENPDSFYSRGEFYHFKLQNYEMAIKDYSRSLEMQNNDFNVLIQRSAAYAEIKKFKMAEQDLIKVLQIAPDYFYSNFTALVFYTFSFYDHEKAIYYANKLKELELTNSQSYNFHLCLVYLKFKAGDISGSLDEINFCNKIDSNNPSTNYARYFTNKDNLIYGLAELSKAIVLIEVYPENEIINEIAENINIIDLLLLRASIFEDLEQYDLALVDLKESLKYAKSDSEVEKINSTVDSLREKK